MENVQAQNHSHLFRSVLFLDVETETVPEVTPGLAVMLP
jgi:hypothetical protein